MTWEERKALERNETGGAAYKSPLDGVRRVIWRGSNVVLADKKSETLDEAISRFETMYPAKEWSDSYPGLCAAFLLGAGFKP